MSEKRKVCDLCSVKLPTKNIYFCNFCGVELCKNCADDNNYYFDTCNVCNTTHCYKNDFKCESMPLSMIYRETCNNCGR